jgi:hypothetical protein
LRKATTGNISLACLPQGKYNYFRRHKSREALKREKEKRMYSMWNAPSDRDYNEQFNPEPPEDEEPEPEEPEIPEELQAHWDADDEGDRRYTMEAEAAGDDAEEDGIARRQPAWAGEPHLSDLPEVA